MRTKNDIPAIEWHLQNNVMPVLDNSAVNGILRTLYKLNNGTITVNDPIVPNSECTVLEMCEDLKIELIEAR